jgi:hypothetical protein
MMSTDYGISIFQLFQAASTKDGIFDSSIRVLFQNWNNLSTVRNILCTKNYSTRYAFFLSAAVMLILLIPGFDIKEVM